MMRSRPRIVQVLYSGLGGHAAVAMTLIEACGSDDPWDHHLIFFGIEPVAPGYGEACARLGISFSYIPVREGRPWAAWPHLARALKASRADAVILHSIKTVAAARLALIGRPLIAVEHQPNALKSRAEWIACAMAQRLADRVVMLSPDYDRTMRARLAWLYSRSRTVIVPTGIDLSPFTLADEPRVQDGTIRIGMAARFSPTKAQETLVEAVGHLVRTHPEIDWRLSMPGDGVRHPAVVEAVRDAGLEERVELPGHLPSNHLPNWFATLDIYAHSSDGETLSTSLLQALAAGIPVVASDVSGISDLLGAPAPGEVPLGRLVPARDAVAFAQAIADDVADPAKTSARAARARLHVQHHYSAKAMRAGYAALLDSLS
jgi:glycosyltransferase involved in cell wall biosynthesis